MRLVDRPVLEVSWLMITGRYREDDGGVDCVAQLLPSVWYPRTLAKAADLARWCAL